MRLNFESAKAEIDKATFLDETGTVVVSYDKVYAILDNLQNSLSEEIMDRAVAESTNANGRTDRNSAYVTSMGIIRGTAK